jgi:hypothetical protein
MVAEQDTVVELNLGCSPEAAVSGALLLQTEYRAYLTFNAQRPVDGFFEDAGTAIVEIVRCAITKFGYPNDEALGGHPLSPKGLTTYGIYEVQNSSWIAALAKQNRITFPDRNNTTLMRHFVFVFHDSTFECLAHNINISLSSEPYETIFKAISSSLLNDPS